MNEHIEVDVIELAYELKRAYESMEYGPDAARQAMLEALGRLSKTQPSSDQRSTDSSQTNR